MPLQLKIITPKKIVLDKEVTSITVPSAQGELTILPKHQHLFALLVEGIIIMKTNEAEDYLAIGGGYVETDGKEVKLLVSRAYGQSDIDEKLTLQALDEAKQLLKMAKDTASRNEATAMLRRSIIDHKLIKRRKR